MNNDLLLDQGPLLPRFSTREPSIRQLITRYYTGAFSLSHAIKLTEEYLAQMKVEAGKNSPPTDWLEDQEFYEAMQTYRFAKETHTLITPAMAFQEVKALIRKRTERCIPSKELEALPDPLPLPPLKPGIRHPNLSTWVYDRFYVHSYAVAYADASLRAALGIKAPIAVPVVCPYDSWKPEKTVA